MTTLVRRDAIDGVCLDVGGVFLLPPPEAVWAARGPDAAGAAPDGEDLRRVHYAAMAAYDAAAGDWTAYLEGFCRGYAAHGAAFESRLEAVRAAFATHPWSVVIEESVAALRLLAGTGVRLAIVSNSDGTVTGQLARLGICQVGAGAGVPVEAIVDSHLAGVAKPAPGIFDAALAAMGTAPGRTLHVGDSRWADVGGARAAGLRPVHLDPMRGCAAGDHAHAARLAELAPLLGAAP